jgi:hypothetical protein
MGEPMTEGRPASGWDRIGQAVTVATVVGFISQIFGFSTRGTALTSVAALAAIGVIFLVLQRNPGIVSKIHSSPISRSVFVAIILASVSGGCFA